MRQDWTDDAEALAREPQVSYAEFSKRFPGYTHRQWGNLRHRNRVRMDKSVMNEAQKKDHSLPDELSPVITLLMEQPRTIEQLAEATDKSQHEVFDLLQELDRKYSLEKNARGYFITREPNANKVKVLHRGSKGHIKFALVSDTQWGNKWQQITYFHQFCELAASEGCEFMAFAGDLDDGTGMYKGHVYELFLQGADQQHEHRLKWWPNVSRSDGTPMVWYILGGNHDASFIKACGIDNVARFCRERPDCTYLGFDDATIELAHGVKINLMHPDGGIPYALSYTPQRLAEGLAPENRPHVAGYGHLHQSMYGGFTGFHNFLVPSFQAQTPYMKRKRRGVTPEIGGWIIELRLGDNGVEEIVPRLISYRKPIPNDYRSYPA
jgi:hypothetical protein